MEGFITKTLGVAIGVFVLAYTIRLGLSLHDAYVAAEQAKATGGSAQ